MPEPEELPAVAVPEDQVIPPMSSSIDPPTLAKIEMLLSLPEEDLLEMLGQEFMKLPEEERIKILSGDLGTS